MKIKSILLIVSLLITYSCTELDLNPPSEASTETWYTTETEVEMAVTDLFKSAFWSRDSESWTDNWTQRDYTTPITDATINSESWFVNSRWQNWYKAIARANRILQNLEEDKADLPQAMKDKFMGNALFIRASMYSKLINRWGDVIYFTDVLDLEEAFTLSRTDKSKVLESIYEDYNAAIEKLPESYGSNENQMATQGTALAMKARTALYNEDWAMARDAAKECMDLGIYELYPDYGELFKSYTKNPKEVLFSIPRSEQLGSADYVAWYIPRTAGGWGGNNPSYSLFSSYLCTDGQPIDESPLFDPNNPFENRDPRCKETIVPFGEPHLGYIYTPHPDSLETLNVNTGEYVTNWDTRANIKWAPFNGLVWKKGVSEEWLDLSAENEIIIMRYADVLLMYAEAKIELDEIDQSVLDAINKVRARAYQVDHTETSEYPAVTTTNQEELRKQLRIERRMEFALEGRRYMDIIRWGIAEKVLNRDIYGLVDPAEKLREEIVEQGGWFWPMTPEIDEDGLPDLSGLYEAGYVRRLAERSFDPNRQYLWPIPSSDIQINDNLEQNPGY